MSADSQHFRLDEWLDYVRNVGAERRAMASHLAVCNQCRATLEMLQKAAEAGARAAAVPSIAPELQRAAIDIFPKRQKHEGTLFGRLAARLVFDSWRDPLPAGVRSASLDCRQALFRAGHYCIDLRLERGRQAGYSSMVGQVSDEIAPESRLPLAAVTLRRGTNDIAHGSVNDYGEFHLDYKSSQGLRLSVLLPDTELIVPLDGLDIRFGSAQQTIR